ncbi:hypothetical protein OG992_32080 [Micromonospora sp. NBC_00362]|uniref:hypothetical protein n=1 Tax=Micromonospora sp. NBC_00362 TaxID=2975975 RepID=UPI002258343F|nr:hypothetical protein [Micromonospora sp. NBC_00362]MCX5121803.1 hypothetical protein [Micromonospora sp. NBC_00362]
MRPVSDVPAVSASGPAAGGPARRRAGRLRTAAALLWPTLRATRISPLLAAGVVGAAIVTPPAVTGSVLPPDEHLTLLRLVMACVGLGVTFTLDDPAKPTTETVPVPAWLGALIRAALAAVVGGACWAAALLVTRSGPETASLPYTDLTREAATVAAVAFLASAIGWRRSPRGIGSPLAAPMLLLGMAVVALLPTPVALLVGVGDGWGAAHDRWTYLLAGTLVASAGVLTVRRYPRVRLTAVRHSPAK